MSAETLQSMWTAVERNRTFLLDYFAKKATLLGVDRLAWHDVEAPLGSVQQYIPYDEGAALVIQQFQQFGTKLAKFAEQAFIKQWIEVENRGNKRPGGFCTTFPASKQTRIFMTYDGTMNNVSTLAHELGHAFHQYVMDDLPDLAQNYAMNVAETASTFAERIVSDAAIRTVTDRATKLVLLDDKIQRSVAFLMNIHARFLFETWFYEERRKGIVHADRLNELMLTAQKTAYHDALGSYHPHFWASKLHFYITEVPFYNFPYTFGFLFSNSVFERALQSGDQFEDQYIALLRDTGVMSAEDLALKHLQADIRSCEFWESTLIPLKNDVQQFVTL
jgi:pepF/M3 family oligoendopeptidase